MATESRRTRELPAGRAGRVTEGGNGIGAAPVPERSRSAFGDPAVNVEVEARRGGVTDAEAARAVRVGAEQEGSTRPEHARDVELREAATTTAPLPPPPAPGTTPQEGTQQADASAGEAQVSAAQDELESSGPGEGETDAEEPGVPGETEEGAAQPEEGGPEGASEGGGPEAPAGDGAGEATPAVAVAESAALLTAKVSQVAAIASQPVRFGRRPEERSRDRLRAFRGARRRAEAEQAATVFVARNAHHVDALAETALSAAPRVLAAAASARSTLNAEVSAGIAQIEAAAAEASGQATALATDATGKLQAAHATTVAAIRAATSDTTAAISANYERVAAELDAMERTQVSGIDAKYGSWDTRFRRAGTTVGNEGMSIARDRARHWRSMKNGESSILDGPIHDNRLEARADAAVDVAQQYKDSFEESAGNTADQIAEGKPAALESVTSSAGQAREALTQHRDSLLQSLDQSQARALDQADQTAEQVLASIDSSLQSTLSSIARVRAGRTQALRSYAAAQAAALEDQAARGIAALLDGAEQAAEGFRAGLADLVETALGMQAPDAASLDPVLSELQSTTDALAAEMLQQAAAGIAAAEASMATEGARAAGAARTLAGSGASEARAVASSYAESVGQLSAQVLAGFASLREGHSNTAKESKEAAQTGFAEAATSLRTAFTQLTGRVEQNFVNTEQELLSGLRENLTALRADIEEYAQEAADRVQPRWKSVLKWVITIVVILAVIVITVLSAGSLGPVGIVLLGATLGALAGAATTIGHNLVDGRNWSDGVVQAMVVGGIGGAFGGLGGVLFKGVASVGLRLGLEAGVDVIGGVIGEIAIGRTPGWGVLAGAAIGAGVGGGLALGSALRGRIRVPTTAVDVPAPTVRPPVDAPAAPVRPAADAVRPPSPPSRARSLLERTGILAPRRPAAPRTPSAEPPARPQPEAPRPASPPPPSPASPPPPRTVPDAAAPLGPRPTRPRPGLRDVEPGAPARQAGEPGVPGPPRPGEPGTPARPRPGEPDVPARPRPGEPSPAPGRQAGEPDVPGRPAEPGAPARQAPQEPTTTPRRPLEPSVPPEARRARDTIRHAVCGRCFPGGTQVLTPGGYRSVEDVAVGELVVTRDEDGLGPMRHGVVTATFVSIAHSLVEVSVEGQTIRSTPGHVWWSADSGWTLAQDLRPGDKLASSDGRLVAIASVREVDESAVTYNIAVDELETYFVAAAPGQVGMWVHNQSVGLRILRPDQVFQTVLPGVIITDRGALRSVIGRSIQASGSYSARVKGLFSYLRQGGGAGYQGFTRAAIENFEAVLTNVGKKGGGVVVAADLARVSGRRVYDLADPAVRAYFMRRYPDFHGMFDRIAAEGVIAVRGQVPARAVQSLVNIPPDMDAATQRYLLDELVQGCAIK